MQIKEMVIYLGNQYELLYEDADDFGMLPPENPPPPEPPEDELLELA